RRLQARGVAGATVAATAAFLPSFVIMLALLPVLDRVRKLAWVRAVMKGMGPAVIGVLVVSLARLTPGRDSRSAGAADPDRQRSPRRRRYASARSSSWAGAPWLACSVVSCRWRSSAVISEVPSPSPRKSFGS